MNRPTQLEALSMVKRMVKKLPRDIVAMALNVSSARLEAWRHARLLPGKFQVVTIWWVHSVMFHPEKVSSWSHILTWGRYAKPNEARQAVPAVFTLRKGKLKVPKGRRRRKAKQSP